MVAESTWALSDLGRWDEVIARALEVVEWTEQGGPNYPGAIAAAQHALVLLHRGRPAEAAPLLDRFLPVAREAGDPQVLVPALAAAAELATTHDELAAAVELVREIETGTRSGANFFRTTYLPSFVTIAYAGNAPELAAAFLDNESRSTGRPAHAVVAARAIVAESLGAADEALPLHEDAARRWAEYGFVFGRAQSLLGAGRCLVALGREHEATAPLKEARELFARLGAKPSLEAVDDVIARVTSRSA